MIRRIDQQVAEGVIDGVAEVVDGKPSSPEKEPQPEEGKRC